MQWGKRIYLDWKILYVNPQVPFIHRNSLPSSTHEGSTGNLVLTFVPHTPKTWLLWLLQTAKGVLTTTCRGQQHAFVASMVQSALSKEEEEEEGRHGCSHGTQTTIMFFGKDIQWHLTFGTVFTFFILYICEYLINVTV